MKPILLAATVVGVALVAGVTGYSLGESAQPSSETADTAAPQQTTAAPHAHGDAPWQPPQVTMTEAEYNATLPPDIHHDSRSRVPLIQRDALPEDRRADYDARIAPDTTSLAGLQGPGGLRLNGSRDAEVGNDLGGRLRELIRLVVSREMDQPFEWGMHEPVALREGLEPQIIDVIRLDKPLDGVPEKEAAVIQLGREMFRQHKVSSETYKRAVAALGLHNLIDMCVLMGDYAETAILLTVNDVRLPYNRPSLLPVE
jgi:4-carboxymuconolactone decarboxylase